MLFLEDIKVKLSLKYQNFLDHKKDVDLKDISLTLHMNIDVEMNMIS